MKRIEIIGHIGQDAEVKDLTNNQVINFSVAVSESYTNKSNGEKVINTTWFECAKWGNNTQIAQYLKKGQQVYISGSPTARSWQKETGELVSVLGINVLNLELLGGKKENSESQAQNTEQSNSSFTPEQINKAISNEEHDDLPF